LGIENSTGKYIARMDADDLSLPKRFESQVEFMDLNSDISISGTWIKTINSYRSKIIKFPTSHSDIYCNLLFNNPFCHPTLIMRKSDIDKYNLRYTDKFYFSQDYKLVFDASDKIKFANLPKVLLHYRKHSNQIAGVYRDQQIKYGNEIRTKLLRTLLIDPSDRDLEIHFNFIHCSLMKSKKLIIESNVWLNKLKDHNDKYLVYDRNDFNIIISKFWFKLCNSYSVLGLWIWKNYWKSNLTPYEGININRIILFYFKCIIKKG
jgi:glycosyltransferase involved in cell wall biosynthesis